MDGDDRHWFCNYNQKSGRGLLITAMKYAEYELINYNYGFAKEAGKDGTAIVEVKIKGRE